MVKASENPLLSNSQLPAFEHIQASHVEPALDLLLAACDEVVACIENDPQAYTWETLVAPLEDVLDRLNRAWSPISHLHSVADNESLRDAYNAGVVRLSKHATELGQNAELFARYQRLSNSPEYLQLAPAQRKVVTNALQDFDLAGVGLNDTDKAVFKSNASELATLCSRFAENVLDASNAWSKHIDDPQRLRGIPATVLNTAAAAAERAGKSGWLLNLDIPCYLGVVSHADDRDLRLEVHNAYATRASDRGPHAHRWDNSQAMESILNLRHQQAHLLGRTNYADVSITQKMAPTTSAVIDFLQDLAAKAKPAAAREFADLQEFAATELGLNELEAHDIAYCSEKMRERRFNLSQEELRPYFPAPHVCEGMFEVARKLFGISVSPPTHTVQTWHPDVVFFDLHAENGALLGHFYIDLYARPHKRGGAWMGECVVRRKTLVGIQRPVAYITCNFTPPPDDGPALLTHDEVTTLFHEFGHALHHLLSRVDHASVSGINGVAWDAVELPSQLMENWCWEEQALAMLSSHHETGERLPENLFKRLQTVRAFHTGMQTVRQLEFALFDFRIHLERNPAQPGQIYSVLEDVRHAVSVVPTPTYNRFAHAFSHIFAGGYAAGYYSYKWAEALSADAFERFEQTGVFNRETGESFKQTVLENGGSQDAMELFIAFRGREPNVEALLRQSGLHPGSEAHAHAPSSVSLGDSA